MKRMPQPSTSGERPFTSVRALDVRPEVARLREALGATLLVTSIRQVVGVRALVRRQVARVREALATALVVANK